MKAVVRMLGPARDVAGAEEVTLEIPPGATVADLKRELAKRLPGLSRAIDTMRIAVNEAFADDSDLLNESDTMALIPPVSGGCSETNLLVELTDASIPFDRVHAFVTGDPKLGGTVLFEGATRAEKHDLHGNLQSLYYEAYKTMALRQLTALAIQAMRRFGAGKTAIVHRLGSVPLGDVSVIVAVACPHRAEAFDACRFLIDTLKKDVPIWKKDVYENGQSCWVDPERSNKPT